MEEANGKRCGKVYRKPEWRKWGQIGELTGPGRLGTPTLAAGMPFSKKISGRTWRVEPGPPMEEA